MARRILIIDKSGYSRKSIEMQLAKSNFSVIQANTILNGIAMAGNIMPDVVLMEINVGSSEINKFISYPEFKNIPIIAMLSNPKEKYIRNIMDAGARDYIEKPIEKKILLEKLEHVLTK
jgi:response regulator RpfG family c-di-GMP phosphodiesterase